MNSSGLPLSSAQFRSLPSSPRSVVDRDGDVGSGVGGGAAAYLNRNASRGATTSTFARHLTRACVAFWSALSAAERFSVSLDDGETRAALETLSCIPMSIEAHLTRWGWTRRQHALLGELVECVRPEPVRHRNPDSSVLLRLPVPLALLPPSPSPPFPVPPPPPSSSSSSVSAPLRSPSPPLPMPPPPASPFVSAPPPPPRSLSPPLSTPADSRDAAAVPFVKIEPGSEGSTSSAKPRSLAAVAVSELQRLITRTYVDSARPWHIDLNGDSNGSLSERGNVGATKAAPRSNLLFRMSERALRLFESARANSNRVGHTYPPRPRSLARTVTRRAWIASWNRALAACGFDEPADGGFGCGTFAATKMLQARPSSLGAHAGNGGFATAAIANGDIFGVYGPAYCCLAAEADRIEANPMTRSGFSTYAYSAKYRHLDATSSPPPPPPPPPSDDGEGDDSEVEAAAEEESEDENDREDRGGGGGGGEGDAKKAAAAEEASARDGGRSTAGGSGKRRRRSSTSPNNSGAAKKPKSASWATAERKRRPAAQRTELVFSSWGFDDCVLGRLNTTTTGGVQSVTVRKSDGSSATVFRESTESSTRPKQRGGSGGGEGGEGGGGIDERDSKRDAPRKLADNARFVEVLLWGQFPTVWAIATRDIAPDEEVFVDYGGIYWAHKARNSSDCHLMEEFYRPSAAILSGLTPKLPIRID